MSTYAIGSVNGDYQGLINLLHTIQFDPDNDVLWFTGNLVSTGIESLAVLRFVKSLGKKAVTVLGSQELDLLAVAAGFGQAELNHSLNEILSAPDSDELLTWLRKRSFIHHDAKLNYTLVHAGIPAEWTFSQALTFAYELESVLSGSNYLSFFENRKQEQLRWHAKLRGWRRVNFIANAYTLMQYCTDQGKLNFNSNIPVENLIPWYQLPERNTANLNIIFSNQAGFSDKHFPGIYPIDHLAAFKL